MVLIDANAIIRIIINDNEEMVKKATEFIDENQVLARNEVLAEVVYVLQKVYKIDKNKICNFLAGLVIAHAPLEQKGDLVDFAWELSEDAIYGRVSVEDTKDLLDGEAMWVELHSIEVEQITH